MLAITRKYLQQMNASANDKVQMVKYITGDTVLDVGVGSGVLGKLISAFKHGVKVVGVDKNIRNCAKENSTHYQDIIKLDARNLQKKISVGEVDTVIFSSVLHEVYSYNNYSIEAVYAALRSAYNIIPKGGRIIIRDGVKMEGNSNVVIKFKDPQDVRKAVKFKNDFKARKIELTVCSNDSVEMPMNDAMEFLYTYTWGEEDYDREVREQYGLFTPKEYIATVKNLLGLELVTYNHYLQEGHNRHLSKKVELYDKTGRRTRFPDSNILLVFQK
ncbi:methyltransferase domain-containing protein [Bacillus haynesii]|uniref:methyltransferase domain-containing protein n=1 Tax=Bacillus haynesii TaxID=1925021 RepID=UPI00227F8E96|nr:methyltransferase domain-containing protein [Bacillus haynesii]MCY7861207.1 methyltransferase domain-containing protein [Bacillus haynesii]MCY8015465.1 methyltransferase domain-containing protein [Bacillus haynesii]MCY8291464.1 methyltransferase domain-containing protein [Bacillus haynesii]MCY8549087.1 methyltransferase domain-containing protein [Bacillus haynesii]